MQSTLACLNRLGHHYSLPGKKKKKDVTVPSTAQMLLHKAGVVEET